MKLHLVGFTLPMPRHRLKRRMGGLWLWVKGETNNPNKEV